MDKNYRIHTNIISDTVLNVNMRQDFDFLEILTLKLRQKDAYRIHSSNYGVIVGRVLANDAFGIPNVKVSVFIERDTNDTSDIESIYPYSEVTSKDKEGRRYNLLPDYSDDDCYRVVGTFPNKRLMLDDDIQLEVYEKYWKYTTVTNYAGDYMLFGVPTGSVTVHVDMDLSDIGVLSQKPRDFEYKGYNVTMFDSPNQFKESTNLDGLAQIFSQNRSVFVYPFWGDADNGVASLTRADIQIQYKFEPTCVFMGSIISDNEGHAIGHTCAPDVNNGMNHQLVGGSGTIEMIRKTTDGLVEEFQIQGNQLIDDNGVWCYQIPMNLDYIGTDEYGNVVPTDNPSKGLPTRTQVRFRISKNETSDEGFSKHTAKYLVPMNPIFAESGTTIYGLGESRNGIVPVINEPGAEVEKMYNFGSSTPDHCFRDLYWNNVYSVKNYIPKVQVAHRAHSKNYGALKGSNLADDQNPIPFNNLHIDVPFTYMIICVLVNIVVKIVTIINTILCVLYEIINTINEIISFIGSLLFFGADISPLGWLLKLLSCISLPAGFDESNTAYFPGCFCDGYGDGPDEMEGDFKPSKDGDKYMDEVQRSLALEYKTVKLDFYQDWINGTLYMPLWYWRKRKKRTFWFDIFGWFKSSAKNDYCSCENYEYSRLKTYVTCDIPYTDNSLEVNHNKDVKSERKWHKNRKSRVYYRRGLIRPFVNKDDLTVYYYAALQATSDNVNVKQSLFERPENFYAIRLYATDIILLGNLIENNLYGIPQFFKCLPSTTANIPAIRTIEEQIGEPNNEDEDDIKYEASTESEDSGVTVVTGMDWGYRGGRQTPSYQLGLFMDLGCTVADTLPKSCINAERLSELGVALDTSYTMKYAFDTESEIKNGKIEADGFITKLELDDMENRAMFATMNHIGFIPQPYQAMHNYYTTQIHDENTNYLIPKFKYIYPVDFDGRQQNFMNDYRDGFMQPMYDEKDDSYLTFRLGAERNLNYEENSERRVRHFYKVPNTIDEHCNNTRDYMYHMPLYNNSFYFYFGVKKGSTAIDKFNEMFYAECFQNNKIPFTISVDTRPRSYCPEAYNNPLDGYAYIRVNADDIRQPFSYSLYDEKDILVISESGMTKKDFVIGGYFEDRTSKPQANENGVIYYQMDMNKPVWDRRRVETPPYDDGLTNQIYYLTLTDSDGKSITEKVKLEMPKIRGEYVTEHLSARFYNTATTRIDYICHEDNHFYGEIHITGFTVDGHDCIITSVTDLGYEEDNNRYKICISGKSEVSNQVCAIFYIQSMTSDEERTVRNCMCDSGNTIAVAQGASDNMVITEGNVSPVFLGLNPNAYNDEGMPDTSKGNRISFFVYQPNSFVATIIQGCPTCDELAQDNASSSIITIYNADNFNTYLNTMPTNFIIGSINDSTAATIGNASNFYRTAPVRNTTDEGIIGWYGVHQEDSYQFGLPQNEASDRNRNLWEDYILVSDDIHTHGMKTRILKFKFDAMFGLCDAVYVINGSQNRFNFTSKGGKYPVLIRSIAPYYDDETKFLRPREVYLFKDNGMVTFPTNYPNILASNASGHSRCTTPPIKPTRPEWNDNYNRTGHNGLLGNYFAGFTDNGSYISKARINGKKNIMRQPNFASISPYSNDGLFKYLGYDEEIQKIDDISTGVIKVYQTDLQNLQPYGDVKERRVNPWLRALNVDRRFDYDFTFLGPLMGDNLRLHSSEEEERVWKSLRISGFTYNGIEMSYDEERNIISADTVTKDEETGDIISQTANKRLEYSYYYSDGDSYEHEDQMGNQVGLGIFVNEQYMEAVTVYNHESSTVWGKMHCIKYKGKLFGYDGARLEEDDSILFDDGDKDNNSSQLIKEPYTNNFAEYDMRNFYWSTFNKERLAQYVNKSANNGQIGSSGNTGLYNLENPFYVFGYPHNMSSLYNCDFNRRSVSGGTVYPTIRFIDICNIYPSMKYFYENEGCSYGIKSSKNLDGSITALAKLAEKTSFIIEFEPAISFVTPNAENKEYGNIVFKKIGNDGDYVRFDAEYANLCFKYNLKSNADFDIYTKVPKVIKVLPYIDFMGHNMQTDGISFIKKSNPSTEFGGEHCNGKSVDDAIDHVTIYTFENPNSSHFFMQEHDMMLPQGVSVGGGYTTKLGCAVDGNFFIKDERYLNSDDNDFGNIIFIKEKLDLGGSFAFSILVDREYQYNRNDGLTRHIRAIEFSDIYDTRHLLVKTVFSGDDWCNTCAQEQTEECPELQEDYCELLSYVEYKKLDTVTPVNEPTGGGSVNSGTGEVSVDTVEEDAEGEGKMYTQVLTFEMRFETEGDPNEIQNTGFGEYTMMAYTFEFIDRAGNKYFITDGVELCSHFEGNILYLRFKVKWNQNMGILNDSRWTNKGEKPVKMAIYGKTPSGFVYKVANGDEYFEINLNGEQEIPESECERKITKFRIV